MVSVAVAEDTIVAAVVPVLAPNTNMSAPAPPVNTSTPNPPVIESAPKPPDNESLPTAPVKVSAPAPPVMVAPVVDKVAVDVNAPVTPDASILDNKTPPPAKVAPIGLVTTIFLTPAEVAVNALDVVVNEAVLFKPLSVMVSTLVVTTEAVCAVVPVRPDLPTLTVIASAVPVVQAVFAKVTVPPACRLMVPAFAKLV